MRSEAGRAEGVTTMDTLKLEGKCGWNETREEEGEASAVCQAIVVAHSYSAPQPFKGSKANSLTRFY